TAEVNRRGSMDCTPWVELLKGGASRECDFTSVCSVGDKSPSLTMSALSSSMWAHDGGHFLKSAISLSWVVCAFQPGLAANRWGQELSPTHPSLRSQTRS